ncbi:MAG: CheR family methyltransferase [Kofleriaceae bacterium]
MGLAPEVIAAIANRLAERAGLELPAWVVDARATARIAACELDPEAYVAWIGSGRGAAELDELIEAVRVGESRLFRHRSQIAALALAVIPALRARGKRTIKVWSAGCAAGEEPYTLASVLSRAGFVPAITATDVSADALAMAERAEYPPAAWNDIPAEWRDDFVLDGERVRVRPEVAELVRFERANLADATAIQRGCDLVWCRNVLIYFTPTARRRVIERLIAATVPGGFVFVGYSEHLRDIPELEAVRAGDAVYYVRREAPGLPGDHRTPATGVPIPPRPLAERRRRDSGKQRTLSRTPPPIKPPVTSPTEDTLSLRGHPSARVVTAELMARLGIAGLARLVVDLDTADLLGDDLAPVLRRARAAARAAHVELELRATRTGTRRWLARHELDEDTP